MFSVEYAREKLDGATGAKKKFSIIKEKWRILSAELIQWMEKAMKFLVNENSEFGIIIQRLNKLLRVRNSRKKLIQFNLFSI